MMTQGTPGSDGRTTMTGKNDPDQMTDAERLDETAGILAAALQRLRTRARGGQEKREFSRDNCLEVPIETSPPAIDP